MKSTKNYLTIVFITIVFGCESNAQKGDFSVESINGPLFKEQWYAGKAELNSYDLVQSRYGANHKGHAVLIFVTEDFSNEKQVKLDDPVGNSFDAVKVMKLNFTKKFNTGIYPYSMMSSIFTPVDRKRYTNTLKVTTSSQEWCGHTFLQLNLNKNNYKVSGFSYFESEGDHNQKISKEILEDELWNMIRLNPDDLPIGNFKMIPGTFSTRLMHYTLEPLSASASLELIDSPEFMEKDVVRYQLRYDQPDRELNIYFKKSFPHTILGWEEIYTGLGGKKLTTRAKRKKTVMLDYWNKNLPGDSIYRKELGLE